MQLFTFANGVLPYLNGLYGRKNLAEIRRYDEALGGLRRVFGHRQAYFCSSSGRVELIGNHLDHNGGKVIACAVNVDIVAAFVPTDRNVIRVASAGRSTLRVPVGDFEPCFGSAALVKGVVRYFAEHGFAVGGFDAYTNSAIPTGVGVSSSAAFELAIGTILSQLYNDGSVPREQLARAGQYAENNYFDKPCGLLDQSVVATGGVVQLSFADGVSVEQLGGLGGVSLVLINSGASHSRLSALYAAIPSDMFAVADYFGCKRLADLPARRFTEHFEDVVAAVGEGAALRAKHFFEESARVEKMGELLRAGDSACVEQVIALVNASGDSSLYQLKNCSVGEGDSAIADIVAFARSVCPCGARVHGGGFAGTVLCVVPVERTAEFVAAATSKYGKERVVELGVRPLGTTTL